MFAFLIKQIHVCLEIKYLLEAKKKESIRLGFRPGSRPQLAGWALPESLVGLRTQRKRPHLGFQIYEKSR